MNSYIFHRKEKLFFFDRMERKSWQKAVDFQKRVRPKKSKKKLPPFLPVNASRNVQNGDRCVSEAREGGQQGWLGVGESGGSIQMGRAKFWFGRKRPVGRGIVAWLGGILAGGGKAEPPRRRSEWWGAAGVEVDGGTRGGHANGSC